MVVKKLFLWIGPLYLALFLVAGCEVAFFVSWPFIFSSFLSTWLKRNFFWWVGPSELPFWTSWLGLRKFKNPKLQILTRKQKPLTGCLNIEGGFFGELVQNYIFGVVGWGVTFFGELAHFNDFASNLCRCISQHILTISLKIYVRTSSFLSS